jgi:hypothetical protein
MNCKKLREKDQPRYLRVCYRCGAPRHKCLQDGQCEHLEPELNRLMQEKMKNEEKAKISTIG